MVGDVIVEVKAKNRIGYPSWTIFFSDLDKATTWLHERSRSEPDNKVFDDIYMIELGYVKINAWYPGRIPWKDECERDGGPTYVLIKKLIVNQGGDYKKEDGSVVFREHDKDTNVWWEVLPRTITFDSDILDIFVANEQQ